MAKLNQHTIYLAGGCFWGVEEYFSRVPSVLDAVSGYANGRSETTRYELIGQTGHAETVQVTYDASQVSLREILLHYFRIINPLSRVMMWVASTAQVFITRRTMTCQSSSKFSKRCLNNTVNL